MSIQRMLRPDASNPFNATPHEGNGVAMLPRAVAVYTFVREPLSHFAAGGLARARLDPYPYAYSSKRRPEPKLSLSPSLNPSLSPSLSPSMSLTPSLSRSPKPD